MEPFALISKISSPLSVNFDKMYVNFIFRNLKGTLKGKNDEGPSTKKVSERTSTEGLNSMNGVCSLSHLSQRKTCFQ